MSRKHHIVILAGLLGLASLVQVAVIRRATTPALDAARFAGIAQSIDEHGLVQTVRTHREQPLFPAWVWLVHEGLERTAGEFPSAWAVSTQLAAAIPLVVAVVPLYFLLVRLVGAAAAVAGSLFFCLLPEVSRLGADGLSDSTHLLFFCIAFWTMGEHIGRRKGEGGGREEVGSGRAWPGLWLLAAGGATALAALARPEVLVLAAALGVTLVAFQFLPGRREAWGRPATAAACFLLGLTVVFAPYVAVAGALTPRAAVGRILGRHRVQEGSLQPAGVGLADTWRLPGGEPMSFDLKEPSITLRQRGYPAAVVRFGKKLADALGYWIGALALLGAWRLRRGLQPNGWATDGDRFVQVFFLLFSLAAIRFAAAEGYLASRHLLALVVAAIGAAGYGAVELGSLLARVELPARLKVLSIRKGRPRHDFAIPKGDRPILAARRSGQSPGRLPAAAWAVVVVAGACCLPQTFARLHHSRLGHRAAGEWLAARADLPGAVLDTLGWTGLYSGRATYPYEEAQAALSDPHLAYLVLEARETGYASGRSRTLCWLVEAAAERAAEFPDPTARRPNQQPVTVYRWYPDRFWRRAAAQLAHSQRGEDRRAQAGPGIRR